MIAVIQKSLEANVSVDDQVVGSIDSGLVILLGVTHTDTQEDINYLVNKIINLRLFPDQEKYFDKSLIETQKEALVISQFTLYASCRKGRRPDFTNAAKPDIAEPLYQQFITELKAQGVKVATGKFGAHMQVSLTNDGPVTIILDSKDKN